MLKEKKMAGGAGGVEPGGDGGNFISIAPILSPFSYQEIALVFFVFINGH